MIPARTSRYRQPLSLQGQHAPVRVRTHTHTHTHREQHTHVHEPWRRGYRQALSLEESLRSSNDNERGGVRGGRCWWGRLSSCLQVSLWCWRGQLTSTHSADTMDAQFKLRVTGRDKLRFTSVAGVGTCVEPRFVQVIDIYQVEQLVPKTTETTHHKFRIISVKRKWTFMFQNGTLQTISWLWKKNTEYNAFEYNTPMIVCQQNPGHSRLVKVEMGEKRCALISFTATWHRSLKPLSLSLQHKVRTRFRFSGDRSQKLPSTESYQHFVQVLPRAGEGWLSGELLQHHTIFIRFTF